eukprot:gnl/TRDRNA2_/TRDRNA2_169668_c1_seq4.p1 gnl/TRDRNA2_/TRDRNA2_169668_c1~~gnl/TRDRNA2_/TRDRNA2_169668_c1_seq4.p1  ORF type:complete len:584 (-),score=105.41 gnl/TRDRNA2_/TRDRNA2_169668_c1_seq4:105-1856(-)
MAEEEGSQSGSNVSNEVDPEEDLRSGNEIPDVAPEETVYSYLMFASLWRQGQKETGGMGYDVYLAYFLAFLCLFMQGFILYAIYGSVVASNVSWKNSIMDTGNDSDHMAVMEEKDDGCKKGGSLCSWKDGQFTCFPPTPQLSSRWHDLDINGDGVWTIEEAKEIQEKIKCELKVNSVEIFNVFVKFLLNRKKIIWLHPDTLAGKKIYEPYFKYAAGDIQVCGFKTTDMCPNMLKRGFFDAPLTHNTVPRVGNTIESAMSYCFALLEGGGFCERTLPSTYSVWKKSAVSECKSPRFDPFVYTHPVTGEAKSMLAVDYEARKDYENAKGTFFITYKSIIIGLWILAMVFEAKGITLLLQWMITYPSPKNKDGSDCVEEYDDNGDVKFKIKSVMFNQRVLFGLMILARFVMLWVLSIVGTSLLLKQTSYMGLVMDAVSLVFVIEIAGILYTQGIRPKAQTEIADHIDPMPVKLLGPKSLTDDASLQDVLWLLFAFAVVGWIMYEYQTTTVIPLYDALECTCVVKGDKCREANKFDYDYWYEYWKVTTPQIFKDIAKLKASVSFAQKRSFGGLLSKSAQAARAMTLG